MNKNYYNIYICLECGCQISEYVYNYSTSKCGIPLCVEHQKWIQYMEQKSTYYALRLYFALKQREVHAVLEKFDGYKQIDIAIPHAKLNIEVDGMHHNYDTNQALADLKRTFHSFMKGYYTIRIPNSLTKNDFILNETANYLADLIHTRLNNNRNYY